MGCCRRVRKHKTQKTVKFDACYGTGAVAPTCTFVLSEAPVLHPHDPNKKRWTKRLYRVGQTRTPVWPRHQARDIQ